MVFTFTPMRGRDSGATLLESFVLSAELAPLATVLPDRTSSIRGLATLIGIAMPIPSTMEVE